MSTAGENSAPIFSDENKLDGTIKDPRVPTTLFFPTSIPIASSNTKAI